MPDAKSHAQIGYLTKFKCPSCDHFLYRSGNFLWCSHVKAGGSCDYGVSSDVTLEKYQKTVQKPKLPPPDEPGFYIFDGIRRMNRGRMATIYDLVEIKRKEVGKRLVLLVYNMDTQRAYPLTMYEGEWTKVLIPFAKRRLL